MAARDLLSLQEAFTRRVQASPDAVQKRARWQKRGAQYLASYPSMPKGSLITVDTKLQRQVIQYIEAVFPAVAAAYNEHLVPVAENAFRRWPVWTGLSKSLLSLEFGLKSETTMVGSIANTAPYSLFIHKGDAVRDLVFRPGEAAADRMATAIADLLA